MDNENLDSEKKESLIETILEKIRGPYITLVASIVSLVSGTISAVGLIPFSHVAQFLMPLLVAAAVALAGNLFSEQTLRKLKGMRIEALIGSITISVIRAETKKRPDSLREVALSLTYLTHIRRKNTKIKIALLIFPALLGFLGLKFPSFELWAPAAASVACVSLIFLKELVVEFRIRKGLFGTNQYEAREMINFLVHHSDDLDFTDSNGKLRSALLPETVPSTRPTTIHGGVLG